MVINRKHKIRQRVKKMIGRIQKMSRILKMPDNKNARVLKEIELKRKGI